MCKASPASATKPEPVVKIDNTSDSFATVVTVELGDQITEMLGTITALKNLGLNIRRAKVAMGEEGSSRTRNKFYLTEATTSDKIVRSARLEEIRMTIIDSILNEFPESGTGFNYGAKDYTSDDNQSKTLGRVRSVIQTTIDVSEAPNGSCSVLKIRTADRPGLLVDIVRVLKDVNMNVISAEVDTVGREAQDEFFVTYRGEPLAPPMVTLITNSLQYYLSLAEVAREESY